MRKKTSPFLSYTNSYVSITSFESTVRMGKRMNVCSSVRRSIMDMVFLMIS